MIKPTLSDYYCLHHLFLFSALCTLEDIFRIFIPDDVKVVR